MNSILPSSPLQPWRQDHLEKLRCALKISEMTWLQILGLSQSEYHAVIVNAVRVGDEALSNLEGALDLSSSLLLSGQLDFSKITFGLVGMGKPLQPRYSDAAYGRMRTTLTLLDYVEEFYGWQRRYEILDHFGMSEAVLGDPTQPVSMNLITDIMTELKRTNWFKEASFYEAGAYSVVQHQGTRLSALFDSIESPKILYEQFVHELVFLFEHNLDYRLTELTPNHCTIQLKTRPLVAEASKVKHLGSAHTCSIRNGVIASLPFYAGLPLAEITETQCVHRGDSTCKVHVNFRAGETRRKARSKLLVEAA